MCLLKQQNCRYQCSVSTLMLYFRERNKNNCQHHKQKRPYYRKHFEGCFKMTGIFTEKGAMAQFQIPGHNTRVAVQGAGVRSPVLVQMPCESQKSGDWALESDCLTPPWFLHFWDFAYLPTSLSSTKKMASAQAIFSVTQLYPIDKTQIALRIGVSETCFVLAFSILCMLELLGQGWHRREIQGMKFTEVLRQAQWPTPSKWCDSERSPFRTECAV